MGQNGVGSSVMRLTRSTRTADAAFILKCTRRCNLRCTYCRDRRGVEYPQFEVSLVAALLEAVAGDPDINSACLIWHGGEPLLLGLPFFRKAKYLEDHLLAGRKSIQNILQTNACLLTDEWADHFVEYGFQLGISLDGPPELQDFYRPMASGQGSFRRCMEGVRILQEHGVRFGVLTVVSEDLLELGPENLMAFFEGISILQYALLPMRKRWERSAQAIVYNRRCGEYLSGIADLWLRRDDPHLRIRELDSKLDRFFGLPHRVCKDAGQCVGKYFGVEPDGSVWHCDKFFDDPRFYLGNILDTPISDLRGSRQMQDLLAIETSFRNRCKE